MKVPPVDYEVTISEEEAKRLATRLRNREYVPRDAMLRLQDCRGVETMTDAIIVFVIAESVPKTALTPEKVFLAESWEQLVGQVFEAHLDDPIRDLFQPMTVEKSPSRFRIPSEAPSVGITAQDEPFESDSVDFETKSVRHSYFTAETTFGILAHHFDTLSTIAENVGDGIVYNMLNRLPDFVEQDGDFVDKLFDSVHDIRNENCMPDIAIVSDDLELDQATATLPVSDDGSVDGHTVGGIEIKTSRRVSEGELIVADGDMLGYECVWEDGKIEVSSPSRAIRDDEIGFDPIRFNYEQQSNSVVTCPDAVQRVRLD